MPKVQINRTAILSETTAWMFRKLVCNKLIINRSTCSVNTTCSILLTQCFKVPACIILPEHSSAPWSLPLQYASITSKNLCHFSHPFLHIPWKVSELHNYFISCFKTLFFFPGILLTNMTSFTYIYIYTHRESLLKPLPVRCARLLHCTLALSFICIILECLILMLKPHILWAENISSLCLWALWATI